MNSLTRSLLEGLEEDKKIVALYGGGFKPPIGGHFEVVDEALKQYPEIDELIILVGSGERNGISQSEAILIWDIYKNYLPSKVKIQPSKSPIGDIYRFAKDNPQDIIYWVIGKREGADDDEKDIADRAKGLEKDTGKYNNIDLKVITTQDEGMRGRNSRAAAKKGKAYFTPFLPDILSKEDKSMVFDIVSPVLNENATYSKDIDYKQMIQDLTKYMIEKGRNIEPLPKVEFMDGDSKNAKNFLGKTAYYDPNTQTIVLYTEGRHPKDIVRSFSHEMVHHTQFLEDRLGNIQTTNTIEDENLDKIEQEANLVGTMTFRNWTDTLNENDYTEAEMKKFRDNRNKTENPSTHFSEEGSLIPIKIKKTKPDPFGINAFARELIDELRGDKDKKYKIYSDMDGVLVDFENRFKRFSGGISPKDYEDKYGKEKFWNLIDKETGVRFWVGMPWMSDGKQLWDYIKSYDPTLLSSPSRSNSSRLGKRVWRKRNLPSTKLVLAQAAKKQNYANPDSILIDDRKSNVDQWIKAGGIGILHTDTMSTINKLKKLGL
mgnify:FL=1|jgi:hypothetical protein|tara:strand:- start:1159 stop:2793 length:1635 start_codon:yes stop_codon:yes gene_type:complete